MLDIQKLKRSSFHQCYKLRKKNLFKPYFNTIFHSRDISMFKMYKWLATISYQEHILNMRLPYICINILMFQSLYYTCTNLP